MKKFGIIGEGFTDQITIENILCGFFDNEDLGEEIAYLPSDEKGGWRAIFKYLTLEDFRNDTLSNEFIILQIDTDISKREQDSEEFGVFYKDDEGNELTIEALINKVIIKLVSKINEGELGFYEEYANKIIFAISVHSIECWLVAYHGEQSETHNCDKVLLETKLPQNIQFSKSKKSRCHEKLSYLAFSERENIDKVAQKDPSFKHFIQSLEKIA